jgi:hypothetical protein
VPLASVAGASGPNLDGHLVAGAIKTALARRRYEARMAQRKTLTEKQVLLLRWIADGCREGILGDGYYRISAAALRNRGLVKISGRGPTWTATITKTGVKAESIWQGSTLRAGDSEVPSGVEPTRMMAAFEKEAVAGPNPVAPIMRSSCNSVG